MHRPSIRAAYAASNGLLDDAAQRQMVDRLQDLQNRLLSDDTAVHRLRRRLPFLPAPAPVRGIYLWGDVGRGKTFLMDLFFDTLAVKRKKRIHFHRMMHDVHATLATLERVRDPLDVVARGIADEARVLCFDEFFVSDIGDAMILGRLLEGLFQRGTTLVTTSNVPPRDLYQDGLQRERFLPAIAMLDLHTEILQLDQGVDYRLQLLQQAGTYVSPADARADERLSAIFRDVARGHAITERRLIVNGRPLGTRREAKGVAWFDFAELCEGPRSAEDYIEIARWYQTVIVTGVPKLTAKHDNAARRFIALVDEFYDRRVKLVVSAASEPGELYSGTRLAFEFQRTVSRLGEMQSNEYLHAAHRP